LWLGGKGEKRKRGRGRFLKHRRPGGGGTFCRPVRVSEMTKEDGAKGRHSIKRGGKYSRRGKEFGGKQRLPEWPAPDVTWASCQVLRKRGLLENGRWTSKRKGRERQGFVKWCLSFLATGFVRDGEGRDDVFTGCGCWRAPRSRKRFFRDLADEMREKGAMGRKGISSPLRSSFTKRHS